MNVYIFNADVFCADCAADIIVLVAGGRGRHSAYIPSFAFTRPVSRLITASGADKTAGVAR